MLRALAKLRRRNIRAEQLARNVSSTVPRFTSTASAANPWPLHPPLLSQSRSTWPTARRSLAHILAAITHDQPQSLPANPTPKFYSSIDDEAEHSPAVNPITRLKATPEQQRAISTIVQNTYFGSPGEIIQAFRDWATVLTCLPRGDQAWGVLFERIELCNRSSSNSHQHLQPPASPKWNKQEIEHDDDDDDESFSNDAGLWTQQTVDDTPHSITTSCEHGNIDGYKAVWAGYFRAVEPAMLSRSSNSALFLFRLLLQTIYSHSEGTDSTPLSNAQWLMEEHDAHRSSFADTRPLLSPNQMAAVSPETTAAALITRLFDLQQIPSLFEQTWLDYATDTTPSPRPLVISPSTFLPILVECAPAILISTKDATRFVQTWYPALDEHLSDPDHTRLWNLLFTHLAPFAESAWKGWSDSSSNRAPSTRRIGGGMHEAWPEISPRLHINEESKNKLASEFLFKIIVAYTYGQPEWTEWKQNVVHLFDTFFEGCGDFDPGPTYFPSYWPRKVILYSDTRLGQMLDDVLGHLFPPERIVDLVERIWLPEEMPGGSAITIKTVIPLYRSKRLCATLICNAKRLRKITYVSRSLILVLRMIEIQTRERREADAKDHSCVQNTKYKADTDRRGEHGDVLLRNMERRLANLQPRIAWADTLSNDDDLEMREYKWKMRERMRETGRMLEGQLSEKTLAEPGSAIEFGVDPLVDERSSRMEKEWEWEIQAKIEMEMSRGVVFEEPGRLTAQTAEPQVETPTSDPNLETSDPDERIPTVFGYFGTIVEVLNLTYTLVQFKAARGRDKPAQIALLPVVEKAHAFVLSEVGRNNTTISPMTTSLMIAYRAIGCHDMVVELWNERWEKGWGVENPRMIVELFESCKSAGDVSLAISACSYLRETHNECMGQYDVWTAYLTCLATHGEWERVIRVLTGDMKSMLGDPPAPHPDLFLLRALAKEWIRQVEENKKLAEKKDSVCGLGDAELASHEALSRINDVLNTELPKSWDLAKIVERWDKGKRQRARRRKLAHTTSE